MFIYFVRKLNLFVVTFLLLTFVSFNIARLTPQGPWSDLSLFQGWITYLTDLFSLNFGVTRFGAPILDELIRYFPATLELCILAFMLALLVGVPIGTLAGIKRGKWMDNMITTVTLLGFSIPVFWLAILLMMLFSLHFTWFPVSGRHSLLYQLDYVTGFGLIDIFLMDRTYRQEALLEVLSHLVLPVLTLALSPLTEVVRLTRSSVAEVMTHNYVRFAPTKGLSMFTILHRHVLQNALPPIIPKLGLQLSTMFTMTFVVEYIFNWPGIGRWLLEAVTDKDYMAIQAGVICIATLVLSANILSDLLGAMLNPLVRKEWNAVK
uniref:ABC transporter permease n=1 Tax=Thaumasiovibrio occultus TaxID=1891184 RepID=UPI000B36013D|nr:ABC transporter permease subunit [Thaumasiovibrio occultus]